MSVRHSRTASSSDETRRHIISSIFPPRDEDGIPEETLISYVKVYEEEAGSPEGGAKTRYLMLAGRSNPQTRYHVADLEVSDEVREGGHPQGEAQQQPVILEGEDLAARGYASPRGGRSALEILLLSRCADSKNRSLPTSRSP